MVWRGRQVACTPNFQVTNEIRLCKQRGHHGRPRRDGASFYTYCAVLVLTIRVKWTPKPAPVKRRPRPLAAFISRNSRASTSISSSPPPSSLTLPMHLTSQATVDLYHASLSLLLRPLGLRPSPP